MPRLRVSTTLSLLALLVGIGGTHWLSGFTDDWTGPRTRPAASIAVRSHGRHVHPRSHAPPRVVGALPDTVVSATPAAPPALVPLDTPPGPSSWAELRGHLDGRVILDVATDGSGRVAGVRVAQSSGDPVLDAHAVATVRRWRFAVPAGMAGVHGELPMRFDSRAPATPP